MCAVAKQIGVHKITNPEFSNYQRNKEQGEKPLMSSNKKAS